MKRNIAFFTIAMAALFTACSNSADKEEIERLRAENEALKATAVSETEAFTAQIPATVGMTTTDEMVFTELNGLSWGMTLSEVKRAKGFTDNQMAVDGNEVMVYTSDRTYRFDFNDEGELDYCGFVVDYSSSKMNSLYDQLEDAGFEFYDTSYEEKKIRYYYVYAKNDTVIAADVDVSLNYDTIFVGIMCTDSDSLQ